MANKIILIDHHDNPRDDLVTLRLGEMGFDLDLRCPFEGDQLPEIDADTIGAVIYGGAQNVTELDQFPFLELEIQWIKNAMEQNLPLIGICLGAQLIAHALGAKVGPHKDGLCEFGYYEITPTANGSSWFDQKMRVTEAHYEHFELPKDAELLATGENFPNQAFRYKDNVFALQFHPEVTTKIFQRWQDSDWAFFDRPGSQTREQQNAVIEAADLIQGKWFYNFLEKIFGHAVPNHQHPEPN